MKEEVGLEEKYPDFLNKLYERHQYELVYSRTFRHWPTQLVKLMLSSIKYPRTMVKVTNIIYTLRKYYGYTLNKKLVIRAMKIYDKYEDQLDSYEFSRRSIEHKEGRYKLKMITPKQALLEQKKRGFIHINDFIDFDRTANHLISLANKNYYYPINFYNGTRVYEHNQRMSIYIAGSLFSVSGYTRISR